MRSRARAEARSLTRGRRESQATQLLPRQMPAPALGFAGESERCFLLLSVCSVASRLSTHCSFSVYLKKGLILPSWFLTALPKSQRKKGGATSRCFLRQVPALSWWQPRRLSVGPLPLATLCRRWAKQWLPGKRH